MPIDTAIVPVAEILPLRWEILRPGHPREAALFAEDEAVGAFHIAAYDEAGAVMACASFSPGQLEGEPAAAYRLRGMASDPAVRGQGYGLAVLEAGLAEAAERGAELVWCNARTGAMGFYERHGFAIHGEEFMIEGVGPHYVMTIKVSPVGARP